VKFTPDTTRIAQGGQDPEYGQGERDTPSTRLRALVQTLRGVIGRDWEHAEGFAESLEDIATQIEQERT